MPSGQSAGYYVIDVREYASGTTPSTSDIKISRERFYWSGSTATAAVEAAGDSEPDIEPVTLAEVKAALQIDTTIFEDTMDTVVSIAYGTQDVVASYGLVGTGVGATGYEVVVNFTVGTVGTNGTIDCKVQDSDDDSTYTDVTSGAFTQVVAANDNATFEKQYTAGKAYVRVVCTVGVAASPFGVSMIRRAHTYDQDTVLNALIKTARIEAEEFTNRVFIRRTLTLSLDKWPNGDCIEIPNAPLVSVTSIVYKDTDGTEATFSTDYYLVEINPDPEAYGQGRIVLGYGDEWPTTVLYPSLPITITYVCGYGTATSNVPEPIRRGILFDIMALYERTNEGPGYLSAMRRSKVYPLYSKYKDYRFD